MCQRENTLILELTGWRRRLYVISTLIGSVFLCIAPWLLLGHLHAQMIPVTWKLFVALAALGAGMALLELSQLRLLNTRLEVTPEVIRRIRPSGHVAEFRWEDYADIHFLRPPLLGFRTGGLRLSYGWPGNMWPGYVTYRQLREIFAVAGIDPELDGFAGRFAQVFGEVIRLRRRTSRRRG